MLRAPHTPRHHPPLILLPLSLLASQAHMDVSKEGKEKAGKNPLLGDAKLGLLRLLLTQQAYATSGALVFARAQRASHPDAASSERLRRRRSMARARVRARRTRARTSARKSRRT